MHIGRRALGLCLVLLGGCLGANPAPDEPVARDAQAHWRQRPHVRAFYSGHSLSDGVPEAVAAIAKSLQREFDFEFQTLAGSLLRERTKGSDPKALDFEGYKSGRNRHSDGLDVGAELRGQRGRSSGPYDALVVTERHDLPWAAYHASTAEYLAHMVEQLGTGNAHADAFLYHTWLELDPSAPRAWVRYEREALRLWECVASQANRELASHQRELHVRVLPGATALAQLVDDVIAGRVPGMANGSSARRMALLFRDRVHLTATGTYFMGLVHYAVLFGQSPQGAAAPAEVPAEALPYMQRLAFEHTRDYAQLAAGAAARSPSACREFAARTMCPAFYALRGGPPAGLWARARRAYDIKRCRDGYLDPEDALNPFH
jgi:hypothetical protein